jgi:hypothetical protein
MIVRYAGTPRESRQVQTVPLDQNAQTVRVKLKGGRLGEPLAVPTAPAKAARGKRDRRSVVSRIPAANSPRATPGATTSNVGFQPVVAFVPSGAQLTALAVVSGDRRYVRISASPLFTSVTDVFTFSFAGSSGGGNF